MCNTEKIRSAFTQRSAIIPVMVGIKIEAIPMVPKTAPNCVPSQCFVPNQKLAIVISHAPQTKTGEN
jgi:hypothetical protein